jgi:stalled ribosome rescue protein Dom34
MTFTHSVIWLDHHKALVIEFDPETMHERRLEATSHPTSQHRSEVRSEHEFFARVCDAVADMDSILVTGGHTAQADFRHYIDKHRPTLTDRISGWETVDHRTSAQLVALARQRQQESAKGLAPRP